MTLYYSGVTVARKTNGSTLQKFPSGLPNGSKKTSSHSEGYCILDCIYQSNADDQGVFYVLDVMCWKVTFVFYFNRCPKCNTETLGISVVQLHYRVSPLLAARKTDRRKCCDPNTCESVPVFGTSSHSTLYCEFNDFACKFSRYRVLSAISEDSKRLTKPHFSTSST